MPKKSPTEKSQELRAWEVQIKEIMNIVPNEKYTYTKPTNKYYRFIDHFKGWVEHELFGSVYNSDQIADLTADQIEWKAVARNSGFLTNDWWELALNGNSKSLAQLPKLSNEVEDREMLKERIYDKLLPAYRALKESFDNRSVFQWWTNHRQYTAERDALKVLKSLFKSMTGDKIEDIDAKLETFQGEVPSSNFVEVFKAVNEREQVARNMQQNVVEVNGVVLHDADALIHDEVPAQEENDVEFQKFEQQAIIEQESGVDAKAFQELTMEEQFTIYTEDENFERLVIAELKEAMEGAQCGLSANLLNVMFKSQVYTPLRNEAKRFCVEFDTLKEQGSTKTERASTVMNFAESMFKIALQATKNLKLSDPKERIIVAQKFTDIMLNSATPVAFRQNKLNDFGKPMYGKFGDAFAVLNKEDVMREVLKKDFSEQVVEKAIMDAQDVFSKLSGEKPEQGPAPAPEGFEYAKRDLDLNNVVKIDYRPNPDHLKEEGKMLSKLQLLTKPEDPKNPNSFVAIPDKDLKMIINNNVRRYKAAREIFKQNNTIDMNNNNHTDRNAVIRGISKLEFKWSEEDKQLRTEHCPNYKINTVDEAMNLKVEKIVVNEANKTEVKVNEDQNKDVEANKNVIVDEKKDLIDDILNEVSDKESEIVPKIEDKGEKIDVKIIEGRN